MVVSSTIESAYKGEVVAAERSIMYIINRKGARTKACGTLQPIGRYSEIVDSNHLDSIRKLVLYPLTHLITHTELSFQFIKK